MRVAWISYGFPEYSVAHVNRMTGQHDVLLMLPSQCNEAIEASVAPDVRYQPFDKPRLRQPLKQLLSVRSILRTLDSFKPDVVHFQQGHLWFNLGLRKLRKKYPLVLTIHDPRYHSGDAESKKTPQWATDYGFKQADQLILHGRALADQVHQIFGFKRDMLHVIPHINMCEEPETSNIQPQEPGNILFFGRIWDYKGLDYLIEAEPFITAKYPNVKIVIGGTGDDFQRYRAKMVNPDRFEVHNRWISSQDQASMFQRASVVVLPYTDATQSGVVPVAYAYEKPVVATSVGALPECVEHEKTGLLVPPRDPVSLANAILQLLDNPSLAREFGKAGKRWLDTVASPMPVVEATIRVYDHAIRFKNR
jgi:glycosyltransferase involved in cell wall biosynthesis